MPPYSPENGRVRSADEQPQSSLTVENDCEPIPETELPRLFEMFYRGDKCATARADTDWDWPFCRKYCSARPDMQGGKYKGRCAVHRLQ
ncbi:MAG: hypothetical protein ACLT4C_00590 [Butyricicoccus sp.]